MTAVPKTKIIIILLNALLLISGSNVLSQTNEYLWAIQHYCAGDDTCYGITTDLQRLGDVQHNVNSGKFDAGTDTRFFNYNKNTDGSSGQIINVADLYVLGDCWHNGIAPFFL